MIWQGYLKVKINKLNDGVREDLSPLRSLAVGDKFLDSSYPKAKTIW